MDMTERQCTSSCSSAWLITSCMQDIPPKDAVAALLATSGDAESAMAHALQVSGPAEQGNPENAAKLDVWAKMAEAQRVLERFSKSGTRQGHKSLIRTAVKEDSIQLMNLPVVN